MTRHLCSEALCGAGVALNLEDDENGMQSWLEDLDPDVQSELQEIISNSRLSEYYLALARDLDVMEPKLPDEVHSLPTPCLPQSIAEGVGACVYSLLLMPYDTRSLSMPGQTGLFWQGSPYTTFWISEQNCVGRCYRC